ncbi:DAK2 domain-containing protein [Rhodococcus sp. X156]|uniref:DAK2 domain-containing protein n=1 Tax=Rhodococcus sp. X156 TaxID=2499145 RepID=UPI0019D2CE12|nr:DAK2 domain-containing protein [Rhodococcus sp. X156]
MLQLLDAAALRRWADACVEVLTTHCAEINGLNVFPVADSDTGSNLLHTLRAGLDALVRAPEEVSQSCSATAAALARGTLVGARGNSGVLISQVLRGLAETVPTDAGLTGADLSAALRRADELAYASVGEPVEGTVLTVLHAAAEAAQRVEQPSLAAVATAAARAATEALAHTPSQLSVLAKAGVVDAGGRGLVLMLDALVAVVTGTAAPNPVRTVSARPAEMLTAERESGSSAHDYEVMYLLDGTGPEQVAGLREHLNAIGDSVVVVGDGSDLYSVHVHCNDIGAAVEAGVVAGRPHRITVARFADVAEPRQDSGRLTRERALLALVSGAETASLFAGEGAVVLRCGPGPVEPDAVRSAIEDTRAGHVTVLPNGLVPQRELIDVVAAIRKAGQGVTVLPSSSPVQGLAALAVHDPGRDHEDDTLAMAEAATATRRGAVRVAREQALTWVGRCEPGDVLGLLDDEVVLIARGDDPAEQQSEAVRGLLDRMLDAGGELVTVLTGEGMDATLEQEMADHVQAVHPGVELVVYPGGVLGDVAVLGVE